MRVRIGIGTGPAVVDAAALASLGDGLVELGFDSLWLPEVLTAPGVDPLVGLAWAGSHNPRLKLGTTMLLPGRNLVRLAKQTAVLDSLSGGRLLLTFVPGLARGPERTAVGVPPDQRGSVIDEALPLLRRLWAGERVSYRGPAGHFEEATISTLPVQQPLEVWLGGTAPGALRRCGQLADGWLPAMCTPEETAEGRKVVEEAAGEAGRHISPEHFGVSVGYAHHGLDGTAREALRARSKGRPVDELVPVGLRALRSLLERFIAVGFSKFVLRPLEPPADWLDELEGLADAVGDLQS